MISLSVCASLAPTVGGVPVDPTFLETERACHVEVIATDQKGGKVEIEVTEEDGVLSVTGLKLGNTYTINEIERALVQAGEGWVIPAVMRLIVVDVKKALTGQQGGVKG